MLDINEIGLNCSNPIKNPDVLSEMEMEDLL